MEKRQEYAKLWDSLTRHYDTVRQAEIANAFPILLVLNGAEKALTTSEISQRISTNSKGSIFRNPGTLKSSLDVLSRSELVNGKDIPNLSNKNKNKPIAKTLYSISPKGKKLIKAWAGFLTALE